MNQSEGQVPEDATPGRRPPPPPPRPPGVAPSPRPVSWRPFGRPWFEVAATAGGIALGVVLLFGVFAKVIDPESFTETVTAEGLDFLLPAAAVAYVALALEAGIGVLLLLALRRTWVLIAATALVVFFVFLTGRAYIHFLQGKVSDAESCGCFGRLIERSPAAAFWQDVAMLVPSLVLAWFARPAGWRLPKARGIVAGAVTVGTIVFAALAPSLPLDSLATRLSVGTNLKEICTGSAPKKLCLPDVLPLAMDGKHYVVMLDPKAATAEKAYADLDALRIAALDGPPGLWLLVQGGDEDIQQLRNRGFNAAAAPKSIMRALYRRLPRSFLVEDGIVGRTWDGLPDTGSQGSPPPR